MGVGDAGRGTGDAADSAVQTNTVKPFEARLVSDSAGLTICPGDCAELRAIAENGVPPYRYEFSHGLASSGGPHRVCPSVTTTYTVTVSDSSYDGEFGARSAPLMRSVTLRVAENCATGVTDAGVDAGLAPSDASLDAGPAAEGGIVDARSDAPEIMTDSGAPMTGVPLCSKVVAYAAVEDDPAAYVDIWSDDFGSKVAVDSQGAAVLAATIVGRVRLANGATMGGDGRAILVAKVDADCNPLWYASLKGYRTAHEPIIAVDSQNRIAVLATTQAERPVTGTATSAIYLAMLSPTGSLLWEKRIESLPGRQWQKALRFDGNDELVVMTAAAPGSDFGSGPLGFAGAVGQDPSVTVLAKFRTNGALLWSKLLADVPTRASMAIQNRTDIVFHGWSDVARNWEAGGRTSGSQTAPAHGYLVRANGRGDFIWSKVVSTGEVEKYSWHWLDVTPANQLVLSNFAEDGAATIASIDGVPLNSARIIDRQVAVGDEWNKSNVTAQGEILIGGNFHGSTRVTGVSMNAGSLGAEDAFVQKLDGTGALQWTYHTRSTYPGALSSEFLLGVAHDQGGQAVMLLNVSDEDRSSLVLTKLAR